MTGLPTGLTRPRVQCSVSIWIAAAALLCTPQSARSQCYSFQGGSQASVVLNIKDLPAPVITSPGGIVTYNYYLAYVSGNSVTITEGGYHYYFTSLTNFSIAAVPSSPITPSTLRVYLSYQGIEAIITLSEGPESIFQNGLPALLPAASQWPTTALTNRCCSENLREPYGDIHH